MKASRSLVISAGLCFISGLFISPLLFRAENKGNFNSQRAAQFSPRKSQKIDHGGDGDQTDKTELKAGPVTEPASHSKGLLVEKVKVLCWIMTGPKTHHTKVSTIDGPLESPM